MTNLSFCERRLFSWLSELLDRRRFDKIICVERKATAIIRALLDLTDNFDVDWSWDWVLSSDALQFLPKNYLKGQRVLVFNEMIHHGSSTLRTIKAVLSNSPGVKRIETAAFIVHEDFQTHGVWRTKKFRSEPNAYSPDYAVHRSASKEFYTFTRQQLIEMLKSKGALMLDTEHLETTFKLDLPFSQLVDALCAFGKPVVYQSDVLDAFPGVTVRQPVVEKIDRLRELLPPGTDLELSAPKKVRLVRRGPNEFAFIPIWYPPIEMDQVDIYVSSARFPKYIKPALEACPSKKKYSLVFHLSSLIAGLELTRSVWAGLGPLVGNGIRPNFGGSKGLGPSLGHIRALYPLLDFAELECALGSVISAYKNILSGKRIHSMTGWKPTSKKGPTRITTVDADTARHQCLQVLISIVDSKDAFDLEEEEWFVRDEERRSGARFISFTWSEFWDRGKILGIDKSVRSILMDRAIDNAVLKTSDSIIEHDNRRFIVRAYEPDSEFALQALRRIARGAEEVIIS